MGMNPLFDKAIAYVSETVRLFYSGKDVERVVGRFADGFSWIGAGEVEFSTDSEGIVLYLQERAPLAPPCEVSDEDFRLVNVGERSCTVMGRYRVRTSADSGLVLEERQRCSYELVDEGGELRIGHVHVSNPYQAMKDEEYFPFEAGRQSYEYLQQLVREKTETIDLITANIAGGLKVSEDGEPYRLVYVNEGLARMLGYTTEEFMSMSGGTASGIVHPPDLDQALADVRRCFAQGSSYETEYRVRKKNGELAWIMDSGRKMKAVDGSVKISSLLMDITSRKRAEQALLLEQERYRIALRSVTDVLFEYDVEQDALIEFERGAATADGAPPEERRYPRYTASAESGRIHPDDFRRLSEALRDDGSTTMEVRHRVAGSGDAWRWVRMHARMLRDAEGRPVRTIGSWKDVTEERRRIEQLVDQARRDPLTKLLNQGAAAELVAQQLPACAERGTGALLVADIDDFKAVNDTYGHLAGDDLLVGVAGVLAEGLRGEEGFAARIGGDEFVLFLPHADADRARKAGERLGRAASALQVSGRQVTLSVGVALAGADGDDYEHLFAAADRALYDAKREGKDCTRFAGGRRP